MKVKVRPLSDRVLIEQSDANKVTKGGIVLPDNAKEKPQKGEVIAVGNGKKNDEGKCSPLDVKVGDSILFGKYAGTEVKVEGDEFLMMREDDVLAVIEK
jgi:chaperonin GroES